MPLTPEQFDKLVTKEYFEEKLAEKLEGIATKKDIDRVLSAVDGIVLKHKKFESEMAANVGAHDRFEKKLTESNGRVEVLERKLGVSRIGA
jgi:hypothetical protein